MTDVLIQHAIENVWCNPNQDTKNIIRPKFIGNKNGDSYKITVAGEDILLPTSETFYVYQIGQIELTRLSIAPKWKVLVKNEWQNVAQEMQKESINIDIYSDRGVQLPKSDSYFCVTTGMCLIIAVRECKSFPIDLKNESPSIQFYKNTFFSRNKSILSPNIEVVKKEVKTPTDIAFIQSESLRLQSLTGALVAYVNGLFVREITARTVSLGDYVELVWDSSIKRIVTFPISTLRTFTSTLDKNTKYLLSYAYSGNEIIDYQDDIEVFLIDQSKPNSRGVYCHRNSDKSLRMVTHRDYGLSVSHLDYLNEKLETAWPDSVLGLKEKYVTVFIKNSGYSRELVYDSNRLCDLMKLPEYDRERALLGLDSVVSNWYAPNLETSSYTKIMRSEYLEIDRALVTDAYGYDSLSVLIGNTPIKTEYSSGILQAKLSVGNFKNTTVYEYDDKGHLILSDYHQNGYWYSCRDGRTKLIEALRGLGSKRPNTLFGTDNIPIRPNTSYRVYLSHVNSITGIWLKDWKDITGSDYYTIENGYLKWSDKDFSYILQVRFDDTFLDYEVEVPITNSVLRLPLTIEEERVKGVVTKEILEIPFGELDVFLNNKSLIEGFDYSYSFPYLNIFNKKFLNNGSASDPQKIRIRFKGFCNSTLNKNELSDRGFVVHGVLSNNDKYDLREDRVQRLVLDGSVFHKDDLRFSEDNSGVSVFDSINGQPYSVSDVVVPITEFASDDTYSLREKAILVTKAVSNYLSDRLPQSKRDSVSVVREKHYVYSPFISRLIHALQNNELDKTTISSNLSNDQFLEVLASYEYLLKEDPSRILSKEELLFVDIHPHESTKPKSLSVIQYRFLNRATKLYFGSKIELSGFITINN